MAEMIKICGITRRQDAEAAVSAGASAIGFIFYPPSPRYVTPARAAELGNGLSVLRVGIFVEETAADIAEVMRTARLDIAQIYGGTAPISAAVWKAFRVLDSPEIDAENCDAILLDGQANGSRFDWRIAQEFAARRPKKKLILAGGLNAWNVAEAIRAVHPWGVDASSSLETAPGIKDAEKIRAFVDAAKQARVREPV